MAIHRLTHSSTHRPERILIYGDPKTGKSRLATSLPDTFGDILYFAADPGSESLSSILEPYRKRCIIIKSGAPGPKEKYDPDLDAFTFALTDWRKEAPTANTIVWDTLTATALEILGHLADTGAFSESKHISIGGPMARQNIPMQGDYMAAQNRTFRLLDYLFRIPQHLIIICHATIDESRMGEGTEGGPATTGKATVRTFPGRFDTVLRTSRRLGPAVPGGTATSRFMVYTERQGIWSAGVRSSLPTNPIGLVELEPDPINFWHKFLLTFRQTTTLTPQETAK